jgi:tetratricopeptide (TPR) repeat protein
MKKSIITFTLLLATLFVHAQDPFKVQMDVYTKALKYYDLQTAVTSLYTALAIKPERKDLKDSLVYVYFAGERFPQANAIAEEILIEQPKRTDLREVTAICKQSLGALKESLADYEKVYAESKQVYHLYQIATIQYQLKRYGEAVESLDKVIANPEAETQKVTIRMQNNQSQQVPAKAACLNVKGIIAMELNQTDVAKQNFQAALSNSNDFELAQGNLAALERKLKESAATPSEKQSTPQKKTTSEPVSGGKKK